MDLLIIIKERGIASYKDLAYWTKEQLNTRTIGGYSNAVLRDEVYKLYQAHFGISENQARDLYNTLIEINFFKEETETTESIDGVAAVFTLGLSLLAGPDRHTSYICTTFKI